MNDNEFDGTKSPGEEPVQEFQQYIMNVEETTQRRPALRFAFLVGGVAVGSYFGVGRHVKALVKDTRTLRDVTVNIGQFLAEDLETRRYQSAAIYSAIDRGQDFAYFPGLGVLIGDTAKAAKNGMK